MATYKNFYSAGKALDDHSCFDHLIPGTLQQGHEMEDIDGTNGLLPL